MKNKIVVSIMILIASSSSFSWYGSESSSVSGFITNNQTNFNDFKEQLDKFTQIVDTGVEIGFGAANAAGDILSTGFAAGGLFPTFGGWAGNANYIQNYLIKLNSMKSRLDQLKEYKRQIERYKRFSKLDMRDLRNISELMKAMLETKNETIKFGKDMKDFKEFMDSNFGTKGSQNYYDNLQKAEENLESMYEKSFEKIAGEENVNYKEAVNRTVRMLGSKDPKNIMQALQTLIEYNKVMHISLERLITIVTAQNNKDLVEATKKISEVNKELEDEKRRMKQLDDEIKKGESKFKNRNLGKTFIKVGN